MPRDFRPCRTKYSYCINLKCNVNIKYNLNSFIHQIKDQVGIVTIIQRFCLCLVYDVTAIYLINFLQLYFVFFLNTFLIFIFATFGKNEDETKLNNLLKLASGHNEV